LAVGQEIGSHIWLGRDSLSLAAGVDMTAAAVLQQLDVVSAS